MSVSLLLKDVTSDTVGPETCLRVIGSREPPERMSIQVGITGQASVQVQGRIARDAPWLDLGAPHVKSALAFVEPVPFLRAVSSSMLSGASVSVWAIWAW